MATADLGVILIWGLLSFSPLIDLLRAFRKHIASASSLNTVDHFGGISRNAAESLVMISNR